MKLGVLFSGGKDSTLACSIAMEYHEVKCLISIRSENPESFMFHTPNTHLVEKQAEAMGLPIIVQATKGEKESELEDLKKAIKSAKEKHSIEGVVTGAVESVYQATRIQKICDELSLWCFNPLWQINQVELLHNVVSKGFKAIITGVFAEPFTEDWLGKEINAETIKELQKLQKTHKINPAGEGGEFETTVLNGPIFKKELKVISSKKSYKNYSGVLEVQL